MISSKTLLNTKNPLPQLVKNPTSKSSAKMTKSALVQPPRRSTSKNISTNPLSKNQRSLIDTSEKKILPSSERRNTIVVLFTKSADILPTTALISQPKLFVSFNTYINLPYFLTPKMLNPFSQSSQKKMIIQPELQRQLTAFNLDIANVSLGKIVQLTMLCLDKICEQNDFFKDLIEHKEPFASACKKPYLKIQCKDDKKCTCPTTKKKHFQKHFHKSSSKKPKKPYRYFRKKYPSQFRKKKHNRCFIYKKRGHFACNCPIPVKSVHGVVIPELQQLKLYFGPVVRKLGFPADIPL